MMSEAIGNDLRGKGSPNQAKNHPSLKRETWRRSSGVNEGGRISGALKISKTKDEESERGVGVWMSFPHSALHSALPSVLLSGDDDDDVEEEEEEGCTHDTAAAAGRSLISRETKTT